MIPNQPTAKRRQPLRAGLLIAICFVAALATQMNLPSGMAGVVKGSKGPVFDIVPDNALSTLTAASPKGATFYMQGTIYQFRTINQADCTPLFTGKDLLDRELGTWRAWGTVADNGKLVLHQTLTFDRPDTTPLNSSVEVQGVNGAIAPNGSVTAADTKGNTTGPSEVLSVVGGSGHFSALNGEAVIRPYCNPSPTGTSPFRFDRPFCLGVE